MAVSNPFRPQPPATKVDVAAASVARLTSELGEARSRVARATAELSDALAAEEAGSGRSEVTEKADRVLEAAEREAKRKAVALDAARIHHTRALAEMRRAEHEDTWREVFDIVEARTRIVADLARLSREYGATYLALCQSTDRLASTLPGRPEDPDAAMLRRTQLELAARHELRRCGVEWASAAPLGVAALPDLIPHFEGAARVVKSWKPAAPVSH